MVTRLLLTIFLAGFVAPAAVASPAGSCSQVFAGDDAKTTALLSLETPNAAHQIISRSGLTRDEAMVLVKELIKSGAFAGTYHELAYTMVVKPTLALGAAAADRNANHYAQDYAGLYHSRSSLKVIYRTLAEPTVARQAQVREIGSQMAQYLFDLIEKVKETEKTNDVYLTNGASSPGSTTSWVTDSSDRMLTLTKNDREHLKALGELLARPQARKLVTELYQNSVIDIARYSYRRSSGLVASTMKNSALVPVALASGVLTGVSGFGLIDGVFGGGWEIILGSMAGITAGTTGLNTFNFQNRLLSKAVNSPRLLMSKLASGKMKKNILLAPAVESRSAKLEELLAPYQELRTEVAYQRLRNLGYEFTSDQSISAQDLQDIKAVADSHVFVAGFAVNQFRRQIIYAERMLDLSNEFLEAGYFLGNEVAPQEADARWRQAGLIRNKLAQLQEDSACLLKEIQDRLAYIRALREKLEHALDRFDQAKVEGEIAQLRDSENEISFYESRFRKEFAEELDPALNSLESALRRGLLPR